MKTSKYLFPIIAFISAMSIISAQAQQKTTSNNTERRYRSLPFVPYDSDSEKAKEDSANKLIPAIVKNEFEKKYINAKDIRWHNLENEYEVSYKEDTLEFGTVYYLTYYKGGSKEGKWKSTRINYSKKEIRTKIDPKVLAKIEGALKNHKVSEITNFEYVKCSEKCLFTDTEVGDSATSSEDEGYSVYGKNQIIITNLINWEIY